jgi:hypothetical protein
LASTIPLPSTRCMAYIIRISLVKCFACVYSSTIRYQSPRARNAVFLCFIFFIVHNAFILILSFVLRFLNRLYSVVLHSLRDNAHPFNVPIGGMLLIDSWLHKIIRLVNVCHILTAPESQHYVLSQVLSSIRGNNVNYLNY